MCCVKMGRSDRVASMGSDARRLGFFGHRSVFMIPDNKCMLVSWQSPDHFKVVLLL